jgi:hypothetical protein
VPPANLDQVSASSCFLAPQCQSLRVWWTDGTTTAPPNAVLNWYGVDNPRDAQWGTRNQYYQTSNPDCPEFVLPNSNNAYCALWTSQSKAYWPKGLRIVLQLIDSAHTYEVIVELPQ